MWAGESQGGEDDSDTRWAHRVQGRSSADRAPARCAGCLVGAMKDTVGATTRERHVGRRERKVEWWVHHQRGKS